MRERFGGCGFLPSTAPGFLSFSTAATRALIRDLPRKPNRGVFRGRVKRINSREIKPAITRGVDRCASIGARVRVAARSYDGGGSRDKCLPARNEGRNVSRTFPRERNLGLLNAKITGR